MSHLLSLCQLDLQDVLLRAAELLLDWWRVRILQGLVLVVWTGLRQGDVRVGLHLVIPLTFSVALLPDCQVHITPVHQESRSSQRKSGVDARIHSVRFNTLVSITCCYLVLIKTGLWPLTVIDTHSVDLWSLAVCVLLQQTDWQLVGRLTCLAAAVAPLCCSALCCRWSESDAVLSERQSPPSADSHHLNTQRQQQIIIIIQSVYFAFPHTGDEPDTWESPWPYAFIFRSLWNTQFWSFSAKNRFLPSWPYCGATRVDPLERHTDHSLQTVNRTKSTQPPRVY